MASSLRVYFIVFYAIGFGVLAIATVSWLRRDTAVEQTPSGLRAYLPVLAPLNWLGAPLLILSRIGELEGEYAPLRLAGFALSLYAAFMLLWAPNALGRFLVPRAVIFQDHELVTSGPYRFVRHPIYSGVVSLWLGAALGTMNLVLLCLWPPLVYAFETQAGIEEQLLRAKFGAAYERYSASTGRLVPRLAK